MLKAAGGATESKLHFSARDAWRKMFKQDKAIKAAELSLDEAKRRAQEAERDVQRAEAALEEARKKRSDTAELYAYLTTNLAAEANADKQPAAHAALRQLRAAFGPNGPRLAACVQALESLVMSVVPAAAADYGDDPALHGLDLPAGDGDDHVSICTSIADEELDADVGDLILQSSVAAAEKDLQDLLKQRDQAVAIAIRVDASQKEAALPYQERIRIAQARLEHTKAMLSGPTSSSQGGSPVPATTTTTIIASPTATSSSTTAATGSTVCGGAARMDFESVQHKRPLSQPRPRSASVLQQARNRLGDGSTVAQVRQMPHASALPAAFATAARATSVARNLPPAIGDDAGLPMAFRPLAREGGALRAELREMVRRAQLPRTRGRSPPAAAGSAARSRSERA